MGNELITGNTGNQEIEEITEAKKLEYEETDRHRSDVEVDRRAKAREEMRARRERERKVVEEGSKQEWINNYNEKYKNVKPDEIIPEGFDVQEKKEEPKQAQELKKEEPQNRSVSSSSEPKRRLRSIRE